MKRNLLSLIVVPTASVLLVSGCCTDKRTAYYGTKRTAYYGAPTTERRTEVTAGRRPLPQSNENELRLYKEELVVGKREVSNGGVLVRSVVKTENVNQPIELQHEEYVVERIPANQAPPPAAETAFEGKEVFIPLTREEPVTSKRIIATETVHIGKRANIERQTIARPIRTEDIEITKVEGNKTEAARAEAPAAETANRTANPGDSLTLAREELIVGKATVQNGGVKLRKTIKTEQASQPVELKHEEYTIDRQPVKDQQAVTADFSPREIRVDLKREEAVPAVRNYPTELVRIRKQVQTDKQTIPGTVRREDIEIVKLTPETAAVGGTGTASQSGTATFSGEGKVRAIKGKAECAKCTLHETAACQPVVEVKEGSGTKRYYLVENDVRKNFHDDVWHEGKTVTVRGTMKEKDGKCECTADKIEPAKAD